MRCLIASSLKAKRSLCTLCQEAEGEKGKNVIINHVTLMKRTGGERSCQEANAKNYGWLTAGEKEALVAYCLEVAVRAFPLTRNKFKHPIRLHGARLGLFLRTGDIPELDLSKMVHSTAWVDSSYLHDI